MQESAIKIADKDPNNIANKDNCIVGKIFFIICALTFSPDSVFWKSRRINDLIESLNESVKDSFAAKSFTSLASIPDSAYRKPLSFDRIEVIIEIRRIKQKRKTIK